LPVAGYYWHQNYKIFDIGLTARLWSRSTWFDQGAKGLALIIDNSTAGQIETHRVNSTTFIDIKITTKIPNSNSLSPQINYRAPVILF
jgi:hypothetical protein